MWPMSRVKRPKQFMKIEGENSLLKQTFLRASSLDVDDVISVTASEYKLQTMAEAREFEFNHHLILEPFGKNTAGAIAIAARYALRKFDEDIILLVLPSDHIIKDFEGFEKTVKMATDLTKNEKTQRLENLVLFAITPTCPHMGFGYIKEKEKLGKGFSVEHFVEKPTLQKAEQYLLSKNYYWNAGMFVFGAQTYLSELKKYATEVFEVAEKIDVNSKCYLIDKNVFEKMPNISIDYALMEKSSKVVGIKARFDWNDLGTWDSVATTIKSDENNNKTKGNALLYDTTNSFVFSNSDRMIATIGLDGITIVETSDATLIARNDRLQEVKNVVEQFEKDNNPIAVEHKTEYRP